VYFIVKTHRENVRLHLAISDVNTGVQFLLIFLFITPLRAGCYLTWAMGIIRIVITKFINLIYNAHDVAELFILKR
jgi:hypothetical protein